MAFLHTVREGNTNEELNERRRGAAGLDRGGFKNSTGIDESGIHLKRVKHCKGRRRSECSSLGFEKILQQMKLHQT